MTSADAMPLDEPEDPSEAEHLATGRIGLAVLLAASLVTTVAGLLTLPFGSAAQPGEGLWIVAIAAASTVLCAVGLLLARIAGDGTSAFARSEVRTLMLAAPALLLTVPLVELLGIHIALVLLTLFWIKVPLAATWLRSLITAAAVCASIYVVFVLLLRVPFPAGSLTGL